MGELRPLPRQLLPYYFIFQKETSFLKKIFFLQINIFFYLVLFVWFTKSEIHLSDLKKKCKPCSFKL